MRTRQVEFTQGVPDALRTMQEQGLLLTSVSAENVPNVMTIGWGNPGVIWGRPIFVVYVRPSRYTFGNIEATGEFVVNVPTPEMAEVCLSCGRISGREADKFDKHDLTPVEAGQVKAPLIAECRRFWECRVVHYNDLSDAALEGAIRDDFYTAGDLHRVYYGEIVRSVERAE